jgi:hypothetical protein
MTRRKVETTNEILHRAWAMSGKGGEPRGTGRKKLVRKLRKLREGAAPEPGNIRSATEAKYKEGLRFIETLFANTGRDLSHLEKVPATKRYAFLSKPWKGRKGREAARDAGTNAKRKNALQTRAIELDRQGRTQAEIAQILNRSERMVRYYLKSR